MVAPRSFIFKSMLLIILLILSLDIVFGACNQASVQEYQYAVYVDNDVVRGWTSTGVTGTYNNIGIAASPASWVCTYEGQVYYRWRSLGATSVSSEACVNAWKYIAKTASSGYVINWDSDQNDCNCKGETWFSNAGTFTESNSQCCGDDGTGDDFATYTNSLTTSSSVSCRRCEDGSDEGTTTLYGNGFWDGTSPITDTIGDCYYDDIICTSSTAQSSAPTSWCGNGYFSSSNTDCTSVDKSSVIYGYCYFGDIPCADGSSDNGEASTILRGNGYVAIDTCYFGDIVCTDGFADHGESCTLEDWEICGDGVQCESCLPYTRLVATQCNLDCSSNDDLKCADDYHCYSGDDVCYPNVNGQPCDSASDCDSEFCEDGFCSSGCDPFSKFNTSSCYSDCTGNDNSKCSIGYHCYSGDSSCYSSVDGQLCDQASDCNSGFCIGGTCGDGCDPYAQLTELSCYTDCASDNNSKCGVGYHCYSGDDDCYIDSIGESCDTGTDCTSGLCIESICSEYCSATYQSDRCSITDTYYTSASSGRCSSSACCTQLIDADNDATFDDSDCVCSESTNGYKCDVNADLAWDGICINTGLEWSCYLDPLSEGVSIDSKSTVWNCSNSILPSVANSTLVSSTVDCSNVTNSVLYDSVVRNTDFTIDSATLNFATIIDGILTSGQIIYNGDYYYAPYDVSEIMVGGIASGRGVLTTSISSVNISGSFYVIYTSGKLGYEVVLDASSIGGSASLVLLDDGSGNDNVADDGIYTSSNIVVSMGGPGDESLILDVDDGLGNLWALSKDIFIDSIVPSGTLYISDSDENIDSAITNSLVVNLQTSYSDNVAVDSCRFGNSLPELYSAEFSTCSVLNSWSLAASAGVKIVYFQIKDTSGNTFTVSDSITLEFPELGAPMVEDTGLYYGFDNQIKYTASFPIGIDSLGVTYEFRLYNSTGCGNFEDDSCNLTPWIFTTSSEVTHVLGFTLDTGFNYSVGVKAFSGSESVQTLSDGYFIDSTLPVISSVTASVNNNTWISNSVISFEIDSSDPESGIIGYSYKVSGSNILPDDTIDQSSDTVYITGLTEGIFYMNLNAKNGGEAFSEIYNYVLKIDSTRPATPTINTSLSDDGILRISWNEISDMSEIALYELVVSSDSDFDEIIETLVVADTYYDYSSADVATYFFKVRAKNGAGLYSLYSNEIEESVDISPPGFETVTPKGLINTKTPVLHVETSENARCEFKDSEDLDFTEFQFTNSNVHDQALSLEDLTSYTYVVRCSDESDNSNSTIAVFNTDISKVPDTFSTVISEVVAYSSMLYDFPVTITSSSIGVSGLIPSKFSVLMDDESLDEFSVEDQGEGEYLITIRVPDSIGRHNMILKYDSLSSNLIVLDIEELLFEVSASISSDAPVNLMNQISSASQNDFTMGVASDSKRIVFNSSAEENRLSIINEIGISSSLIFFAPANITTLGSNDRRLSSGDFLDENSPSFTNPGYDRIIIDIGLSYGDLVLNGNEFSSKGDRTIVIKNEGLTSDNKINLSINLI